MKTISYNSGLVTQDNINLRFDLFKTNSNRKTYQNYFKTNNLRSLHPHIFKSVSGSYVGWLVVLGLTAL